MSRVANAQAADNLDRSLRDPNGRYEIGQTMLEPFKEGRDYVSIGRKFFAVHHAEPGAPLWYDIDPQFSAYTIGSLGGAPRVLDGAQYDRVELKTFPISVLIRISAEEPAIRRFDVLDREQVRGQVEMAKSEDLEVFQLLRNAAGSSNAAAGSTAGSGVSTGVLPPTAMAGSGAFSIAELSKSFARLEHACDSNVENVLMNAISYRNIRVYDAAGTTNLFDPVSRRELIKTGYVGDIWNAQVRLSKKQISNEILLAASPEYLGVIAVRIDLSQMDSPNSELLQYGWVLYEFIAMAQLTNVGSTAYTWQTE